MAVRGEGALRLAWLPQRINTGPRWREREGGRQPGRWKECLHSKKFPFAWVACFSPPFPPHPSSSPSLSLTYCFNSIIHRFLHLQTQDNLEGVMLKEREGGNVSGRATHSEREGRTERVFGWHSQSHTHCSVTYHRVRFNREET
jgi:hypothetical protein